MGRLPLVALLDLDQLGLLQDGQVLPEAAAGQTQGGAEEATLGDTDPARRVTHGCEAWAVRRAEGGSG